MSFKEELAMFLVRSGALKFGEFTLKSGRISPYFMNAGMFNLGSHIETLGKLYADCIKNTLDDKEYDILFGPAYKGIPLVVSASCALYRNYGIDKTYCFDRKEAKDHGEGGVFVGAQLKKGDRVILVEDVISAGTAVREILPKIKSAAEVELNHMFILVDRLEKGINGKTAPMEVEEEFGIKVHPIMNTRELMAILHNKEIDGNIVMNDEIYNKMSDYLEQYGVK